MPQAHRRRIAVIGAGLIGGVLMERLLQTGFASEDVLACERREERRIELAQKWRVAVTDDPRQAAGFGDVVVLAVPPKAVRDVLREIAPHLKPTQIVISVAAAVSLETLEDLAGEGIAVVRVMPNSPSRIGQGMNPAAFGHRVSPEGRAVVRDLLERWGQTLEVPDSLMNLCVGLTGAAPTYVFPVIDALAEAGEAGGVPPDDARRVAAQVVLGSAAMVLGTGEAPAALKALTPLQPLREFQLKTLICEAVDSVRAQMEALQTRLSESSRG